MGTERLGRQLAILLVEDNPGDVRLTEEVLNESGVEYVLTVVGDGESAMAALQGAESVRPDMVLLDLGLPGKSGLEVLADIREDADLRPIPVVILTASQDQKDMLATNRLQATSYITKPLDTDRLATVLDAVRASWLEFRR